MEILGLIIVVILLIILLRKIQDLASEVRRSNQKFTKGIEEIQREIRISKSPSLREKPSPKTQEPVRPSSPPEEKKPIITPPPVTKKEEKPTPPTPIKTPEVAKEKIKDKPKAVADAFRPTELRVLKEPAEGSKTKSTPPPHKSFMERNPDLEKFIGENLLSKIGIVIFVIGMGFLVKLGIDNNVITEPIRVAIGVLIGGGLIGLAHFLRKSFTAFSSVLVGGGLSVLYFTIAIAFHEYQILGQTPAFLIMVLITAFGVLLSVAYDRKELAILAIIGGFGTPIFLSNGGGNIPVLFAYILILDIGMLALVYFKKWNIINTIAFVFTVALYLAVYGDKYTENEEGLRWIMFGYLTVYYIIFYIASIVFNVRKKMQFKYAEIGLLLTNTALYFGLGLSLINGYNNGELNGVFTALLALVNFVFAFVLYKSKNIDKNIIYLVIGLVLTFVSLIAPIQLQGNHITLFWAFEAVLLIWLYHKSGIRLMEISAVVINVAMIVSLIIDWQQNYFPTSGYIELPIILNNIFITTLIVMVSLFASQKLLTQFNDEGDLFGFKASDFRKVILVLFVGTTYLGLIFELNYQFIAAEFPYSKSIILLGIYNLGFLTILIQIGRKISNSNLNSVLMGLSSIGLISYITFYLTAVAKAREAMLNSPGIDYGFYWHYILLVGFISLFVSSLYYVKKQYGFVQPTGRIAVYALSFLAVFALSAEVIHLSIIYQYYPGVSSAESFRDAMKSVIPVVWAISALIMMIGGMRFKLKALRIASLILFLITILKLFIYDLQGNTTGKIVSFIALGAILLGVSFLYQKLKFIIQDDEVEK